MNKYIFLLCCLSAPLSNAMQNAPAQKTAPTESQKACDKCMDESSEIARAWHEYFKDKNQNTHHFGNSTRCTSRQAFDAVRLYHMKECLKYTKEMLKSN